MYINVVIALINKKSFIMFKFLLVVLLPFNYFSSNQVNSLVFSLESLNPQNYPMFYLKSRQFYIQNLSFKSPPDCRQ